MKTTVLELALVLVLTIFAGFQHAFAQEAPAAPAATAQPEAQALAQPAPPTEPAPAQEPPKNSAQAAQELARPTDASLPPVPESLAEMIEIAMDHNPEIVQAEAAMRQADAELNRKRLEVTRELTRLHARRDEVLPLATAGRAPMSEVAIVEAELRYLLGVGVNGIEPSELFFQEREAESLPPQPRPALTEEFKTRLDAPVSIAFPKETPLSEISDFLSEYVELNMVQDVEMGDPKLRITVENVPLRDCLLAMADQCGDLCFLVLDFGILATTREHAETINAPCIPEDVPLRLQGPLPPQSRPQVLEGAKIAEALNAPISLDFGAVPAPLPEVLNFIAEYLEINITVHQDVSALTTDVKLENTPLTAALRALCDQCESLCFVIRDYGILATTRQRAERIAAPTIPEDVPLLVPVMTSSQTGNEKPEPEKLQ